MRSGLEGSEGPKTHDGVPESQPHKHKRAVDMPDKVPGIAPEEYTVGLVCALPLEMAAVELMLDQTHPEIPEQDPADHNSYTLGQIQGHNVVIACLPAGTYGTTTAATVAKDLLRTFKSIRFDLMVGIGGGAPSRIHDIRLGDIVVSQPDRTNGGIIQYDRGKIVKDGEFQRTGSLNAPPQTLLTALARLQAKHMIEESRIPQFLDDLVTKVPKKAKKKFSYQGAIHDCLYLAEYDHIDAGSTCEECDRTRTVQRDERDDTDPVIYYGTIASGNQVIKHGTTRDRLSKELGALCFEMEAAGLQDFPSLVIRGICDYADSHKNKMWQEYAAAAFAKELLSYVRPDRVLQEKPIPQLVPIAKEQLQASKKHLDVSTEHLEEHKRTNQMLENRPLDLHTVHKARYDSVDVGDSPRCVSDTRLRIRQAISAWADQDSGESIFWLVGPAGTGKSTIMRTVADSFTKNKRLAAGYFFKRGEKGRNDTSRLFATLAMQLADAIPSFKNCLRTSLGDLDGDAVEKKGLAAQFEKLLWSPLGQLPPANTSEVPMVIIIDALDECERPEHTSQILTLLSKLPGITTDRNLLRVLLASRSASEIVEALEPLVELATKPEPLFIYAATLCRYVYDEQHPRDPERQLKLWFKQCEENKSQLHQMYDPIFSQLFFGNKNGESSRQLLFLYALTLLAAPLPAPALVALLDLDMDDVYWWLPELHAVLDIPTDSQKPMRVLHKSFSDFLLDQENLGPDNDQVEAADIHALLAAKCVLLMTAELKQDICDIQKLDATPGAVDEKIMNQRIPAHLGYACLYWIYHVEGSERSPENYVYTFLFQDFLHWLEVLSLLGHLSIGTSAVRRLPKLFKVFASELRQRYWSQRLPSLNQVQGVKARWDPYLQTLEGQHDYVSDLAFSPDGELLASATDEGMIRLWIAATGSHLLTLGGYGGPAAKVIFSPNSQYLASVSDSKTVKIWNVMTGTFMHTLDGNMSAAVRQGSADSSRGS
ncbi:hypothetical protein PFICI_11232 [Pestalotiopsis fici W106-1]|uniref:Nephrocystin 3-like N-terminal domain-containing protein n=1 Tax=Pestalotiopsis fici (strain W106-1 / CGMCC3.15140) TaxID=1229662 RepID=W3WU05_PESFW|nr:uncharacterized protein PFICI_11232 [Pestalotiopsis fici W106-1]ETS77358.1 hypothetical protein PFICI_11232 [Pestalotiopsis fici W106-1]